MYNSKCLLFLVALIFTKYLEFICIILCFFIITFIEINCIYFFLDHSSMNKSGNWRVYAGTISQSALQIPYLVKKIIVNENYNSNTNDYDVALLKLSSPVTFSSKLGFLD